MVGHCEPTDQNWTVEQPWSTGPGTGVGSASAESWGDAAWDLAIPRGEFGIPRGNSQIFDAVLWWRIQPQFLR